MATTNQDFRVKHGINVATSGTFGGTVTVATPTENTHAATKLYVDSVVVGAGITASSTDTLTNKSISLGSNTITSTLAQLNTAVSDADLVSLAGSETLTNKTLTSPIITGAVFNDGSIVFEGATADAHETTFDITNPTADRTITFPDATGTVALTESLTTSLSGQYVEVADVGAIDGVPGLDGSKNILAPAGIIFEGTANDYQTTFSVTDPTADRTITFPNATGTVAFTADVDTRLATAGGTMTGAIAMGTSKITGLGTPTDAADAATKSYVDEIAQGLHVHAASYAATTANLNATYSNGTSGVGATLTNAGTQAAFATDGTTPSINSRILVKNQTTSAQNGIYTLTTVGDGSSNWVLTRATDFDSAVEIAGGDFTFVDNGTTLANTGWVHVDELTIVGTDDVVWQQFSGAGTFVAGTGLTLTGNSFSINTGTTVDLSTAQTLTNKTLTSPVISSISNTGTLTLPTSTDTLVGRATTDTLTNKTLASAVATTELTLNATAELRFADTDSSHYVGFKSPATVTTNKIWTLPSADGTAGQVLSTNGSATLSWATASGGAGGAAFSELMLIGA